MAVRVGKECRGRSLQPAPGAVQQEDWRGREGLWNGHQGQPSVRIRGMKYSARRLSLLLLAVAGGVGKECCGRSIQPGAGTVGVDGEGCGMGTRVSRQSDSEEG